MILEPETPAIIHQALEALPLPLLQHLATDPNPEVHVKHELFFSWSELQVNNLTYAVHMLFV